METKRPDWLRKGKPIAEILTIGQYLRPAWRNVAVPRYVSPDELEGLADEARRRCIPRVLAGPYVRSPSMAESLVSKKI